MTSPVDAPAAAPSGRRASAWHRLLPVGVGLAVLVVAVTASGGAPEPAPAGLPDAGPGTGWAVPVLRLLQHVAAVATAAALLVGILPLTAQTVPPVRRWTVAVPAAGWAAAAVAALFVHLSETAGRPVGEVMRVDLMRSYLESVNAARALLATACLAALVAVLSPAVRVRTGRWVLLVLALAALVPPLWTGHAATSTEHRVAAVAVSLHVVAVVLWVGGLLALLEVRRLRELQVGLPRFSALALLCYLLIGASGVVVAWTRLPALSSLWTTGYGGLLLAKAAGLLLLGGLGWWHRQRSLPAAAGGDVGAFRRLAAAELCLMAAVLGLAVALTRTSA